MKVLLKITKLHTSHARIWNQTWSHSSCFKMLSCLRNFSSWNPNYSVTKASPQNSSVDIAADKYWFSTGGRSKVKSAKVGVIWVSSPSLCLSIPNPKLLLASAPHHRWRPCLVLPYNRSPAHYRSPAHVIAHISSMTCSRAHQHIRKISPTCWSQFA